MSKTTIESCDETLNPIVGCSHVSPGCQNCYAERMAGRLAAMGKKQYEAVTHFNDHERWVWLGRTVWVDGVIERALHMHEPRRIFWGSMTDLFHEATPFEWVDRIMAVAALTPQHTHIMLTKRPERMMGYLKQFDGLDLVMEGLRFKGIVPPKCDWPLPNLWLGVTAEDQQRADERIPVLLQIPAAVRFVSIEPMLSAVEIETPGPYKQHVGRQYLCDIRSPFGKHEVISHGLDWVILGGETGPGARPMHPDWARSARGQCQVAGVPFFFKGLGGWEPIGQYRHGSDNVRRGDIVLAPNGAIYTQDDSMLATGTPPPGSWQMRPTRRKCRLLDDREWNEVPEGAK